MKQVDLLIIGSGPGGYVAAIRASQLNRKVTLVEKNLIGGTCLNVGCVPSKALLHIAHQVYDTKNKNDFGLSVENVTLDFTKAQKWKNDRVVKKLRLGVTSLLKKNNVEILEATATFLSKDTVELVSVDKKETVQFKQAIIATGSSAIILPVAPLSNRIVDSTGLLNLESIPKTLTIVGAGYIGSELALAYAMLGTKVTMVEATSQLLPGFDASIAALVQKNFESLGMRILTNATLTQTKEDNDQVYCHVSVNNQEEVLSSEVVLIAVGRKPNTEQLNLSVAQVQVDQKGLITINKQGQTTNPNVYAIGDVVAGMALAHKASYQAKIVAEAINNKSVEMDYKAMPAVCYTTPEVATTGLTLQAANQANIKAQQVEFPLNANSRALASGANQGFVRLVFDTANNMILGAQIVGMNASEIISIVTMAIETGLTIDDVSLMIFPHPTVSEAIMDNSELALGYPIHI